jgi:PAS domain S-box-containing protein
MNDCAERGSPAHREGRDEEWPTIVVFAVVALAVAGGAALTRRTLDGDGVGWVLYPSAGLTLAAMALLPPRRWWTVVCAIAVGHVAVDLVHGLGPVAILGYATANSLQPVVGATLLRWRAAGPLRLDRGHGMFRFLTAAVGAGAAAGAVVGGLTTALRTDVTWWSAGWRWWAAEGLGILAIGAAIIACRDLRRPRRARLVEAVVGGVVVIVVTFVAFVVSHAPPAFLVLPLLVAVAVRFGVAGVLATSAVIATGASVATAAGHGPFAALQMTSQAQVAFAQLFLASVITAAWFLAIGNSARADMAVQREQERARLERTEMERDLGELATALVGQETVDGVANRVAAHLGERDRRRLCAMIVHVRSSDELVLYPSSLPAALREELSALGRVAAGRRGADLLPSAPVWVDDRRGVIELFPGAARLVSIADVGTVGVLPLELGAGADGCLLVARREEDPYGPDERRLLEAGARVVGFAIERARLLEAERLAHAELQRAHELVSVVLQRANDEAARLKESEDRFASLADQSPMMVWVHDADGEQEWVNETYCRFFGVDRDAMRNDQWQVLVHPDDLNEYDAAFRRSVRERAPFHAQARVQNAAGEWRWVESWAQPRFDLSGAFLGHVGATADVTNRHRAEADLAAAHQFVQDVTALVPGVISVMDLQTGVHTFVSRQAFELLGYALDDVTVLGERFVERVLHPDDVGAYEDQLGAARHLADDESVSAEYRFRHRDGTWIWFRTTAVPLERDSDGAVTRIASLTIDISDQKRREVEMQEAAALDAFRAHLADSLTVLEDEDAVLEESTRLLGEHLQSDVRHVGLVQRREGLTRTLSPVERSGPRATLALDLVAHVPDADIVCIEDVQLDDRTDDAHRGAAASLGIRSMVIHMIRVDDSVSGLLVVGRGDPHDWRRDETEAISETAARVSRALERIRTRDAQELQRARAAFLVDLLGEMEAQPTWDACVRALVTALVPDVADYATVERFTPTHEILALDHRDPTLIPVLTALREDHHLPDDDVNAAARSARTREPRLVPLIDATVIAQYAGDPDTAALLARIAPRSHINVPLDLGGGNHGVLFVGTSDPASGEFTPDDLAFMTDLARRLEVVLGAKRVRQAEHHIAATLQQALLPDTVRWHPAAAVEARYVAAGELMQVGGDWYDTFGWPDGHLGVMVGDVVGHNLASAAAMGRLRAAAAALAATSQPSPSALLTALDRFTRTPDGGGLRHSSLRGDRAIHGQTQLHVGRTSAAAPDPTGRERRPVERRPVAPTCGDGPARPPRGIRDTGARHSRRALHRRPGRTAWGVDRRRDRSPPGRSRVPARSTHQRDHRRCDRRPPRLVRRRGRRGRRRIQVLAGARPSRVRGPGRCRVPRRRPPPYRGLVDVATCPGRRRPSCAGRGGGGMHECDRPRISSPGRRPQR